MAKCESCDNKDFNHEKWFKECMKKYGWYAHFVEDGDEQSPTKYNAHTHGVFESFGHLDFQIVLPLPTEVAHSILTALVNHVKDGKIFKPKERYPEVVKDYDVAFIVVKECGRAVLRVIFPDADGNLSRGCFSNENYNQQYVITAESGKYLDGKL